MSYMDEPLRGVDVRRNKVNRDTLSFTHQYRGSYILRALFRSFYKEWRERPCDHAKKPKPWYLYETRLLTNAPVGRYRTYSDHSAGYSVAAYQRFWAPSNYDYIEAGTSYTNWNTVDGVVEADEVQFPIFRCTACGERVEGPEYRIYIVYATK